MKTKMQQDMNYSVLMSVYYKERPEFLLTAMQSIFNQTVKTDDFILVCDGLLTRELDSIIEKTSIVHPELHVIRLEKNCGLGTALNVGMRHCRHELVARMDSDDISRPDRCEKQLNMFLENPELSIVSGTVEEFASSPDQIETKRILPEKHEDIIEFSKKRNPFNHPCVMYKKPDVEAVGGYQDFYLLEDYYLWVRMLQNGAKGYNIQEPLLWMRAGSEMYKRRSGRRYARSQKDLFLYMRKTKFIGAGQYMKSTWIRTISALSPNWIRKYMFKKMVRKAK